MMVVPEHMAGLFRPVAASDNGAIVQIIVIAVVMIASAIGSVLKKKQEQSQGQKPPPAPPPSTRWPPAGSTSGTTVPTARRPVSPQPAGQPTAARQAPPLARAPQAGDSQDRRIDRLDQLERLRQERASTIEREMLERAERLRREAAAKADQARAGAAAAQRIRQADEQAPIARAAMPLPPESVVRRMVADETSGRTREMSDRLKALLADPSWRTAIIMTEILSPPVGLRDPYQQAGTTPPAVSA